MNPNISKIMLRKDCIGWPSLSPSKGKCRLPWILRSASLTKPWSCWGFSAQQVQGINAFIPQRVNIMTDNYLDSFSPSWDLIRLDPNTACSQLHLDEVAKQTFGLDLFGSGSPSSTTADSKSNGSSGESPQDRSHWIWFQIMFYSNTCA